MTVLGEFAAAHLEAWLRMSAKIIVALLLMDLLLSRADREGAGRLGFAALRRWCAGHPAAVLAVGLLAIAAVSWPGPHVFMPDRLDTMRQSMQAWRETGLPLTYRAPDGLLHRGTRGDDAAIYLLAPLFVATGARAEGLIPLLAAGAALVAAALWAWMVRASRRTATGPLAALAALPALLVVAQLWQRSSDIYWLPGAVGVAGSLVLFADDGGAATGDAAFARRWLGFGLAGGVATVFRLTASALALAVIVAGAVLCWREVGRRRLVRLGALLLVVLVPRVVVGTAEAMRDARLEARADAAGPMPSEHLFWHSIYIGMGVSPNPYGLVYKDSIARNYVRGVDPRAGYMSEPYERILHDRVLALAASDPAFVARQLLVKCVMVSGLLLSLLALLPALARITDRRRAARLLAGMGAGLAAGLLPGFLVVPISTYVVGAVSVLVATGALLVYASVAPRMAPVAGAGGQP